MTMATCASTTSGTDVKGLAFTAASVLALDVVLRAAVAVPPRRLAIYYGYPSLVEGAGGDVPRAVRTFAEYDTIVFGDGLELGKASADAGLRAEYQRLTQLIPALHATARKPAIYGYIDLGRSQNLVDAEIVRRIDEWRQLGVDGIFYDEAGRDFGVTPSRRRAAVRATHERKLLAFMNAFDPDDLFDAAGAPGSSGEGDPGALGARDALLLESFAVREGVLQSADATSKRAATAFKWRARTGIKVFAVTTTRSNPFDPGAFAHAWQLANMLGVDGFGWGERAFSAADSKLPFRARGSRLPQRAQRRLSSVSCVSCVCFVSFVYLLSCLSCVCFRVFRVVVITRSRAPAPAQPRRPAAAPR
jgi:hypothetical protein